jgi:protein-disulfide isomerase
MKRLPYLFCTFLLLAAFHAGNVRAADNHNHSHPADSGKLPAGITPEQQASALSKSAWDRLQGQPDAKVKLVEYASLSCPHCAHFHSTILPEIKKNYIDTGKASYIYRDFALNAPALRGAMIARCAPENRYFSFVSALYKQQPDWAFDEKYLDKLQRIARLGGMSDETFKKCLGDTALEKQILTQKQQGMQVLGVMSTPTLFVNGKKVMGARNYEDFAAIIDEALGIKPSPKAASAPATASTPSADTKAPAAK